MLNYLTDLLVSVPKAKNCISMHGRLCTFFPCSHIGSFSDSSHIRQCYIFTNSIIVYAFNAFIKLLYSGHDFLSVAESNRGNTLTNSLTFV